jgi:hypothetical protein
MDIGTTGTMNNTKQPNVERPGRRHWRALSAALLLAACAGSSEPREIQGTTAGNDSIAANAAPGGPDQRVLPETCLGIYQGTIPEYAMRNKFNDDVIINGKRVTVPTSEVKFLLETGNRISMQYDNAEMGRRLIYDGKYEIVKDSAGLFVVTCSLSDGRNVLDMQRRLVFDPELEVVHDGGGTLGEPGFTAQRLK